MKLHGNSRKNKKNHHLYAIMDKESDEVWKYGISGGKIDTDDGLSSRVRSQVNLYNAVAGWLRFFGKILVRNISGRSEALRMEKDHIDQYIKKYGQRPPGNREM